jgi:hypothetical protein
MVLVMQIGGKAEKVFSIIKNLCKRRPYLTSAEAGQKGLLEPKLQHTAPYELGKFPSVILDTGVEDN